MLVRFFNFFVFSSIYIALCALLMVNQTNQLLHLDYNIRQYLAFVFFSTICSYNFHWYLTPATPTEKLRVQWTQQHKTLHFIFFIGGFIGSGVYFWFFTKHIFWMGISVLLTFLYSAPKLPLQPFYLLRKIAIGKTIFLSFVWMYVTTFLPIIFSGKSWEARDILFCVSRFFLIYAICIIFDYRDRENDKKDGIRSLITYLDDKGVRTLFYYCLLLFAFGTAALLLTGFSLTVVLLLMIPGAITLSLFNFATKNFSDYLYYFALDGLMMFSAIFTAFISN
jgi:1,4-dihydroxy-2-naphthoate octaprenyltransferase